MASGFSRGQRRVLTAFVDALLPGEVGVAAPEAGVLAQRIEEFVVRLGTQSVIGFGMLLVVFDLSVPLTWGRLTRFVSLSRDERVRYLRAWDESRLYLRRAMLLLLKTVVTMVYGSLPEVQRAIGYAPGNILAGDLAEVAS